MVSLRRLTKCQSVNIDNAPHLLRSSKSKSKYFQNISTSSERKMTIFRFDLNSVQLNSFNENGNLMTLEDDSLFQSCLIDEGSNLNESKTLEENSNEFLD